MGLIVDANADSCGFGKATSPTALTITTPAAGLKTNGTTGIVVAAISAEWINASGAAGSVSGITSTTLTGWQKRVGVTGNFGSSSGSAWHDAEIWWTTFSSALIGELPIPSFTTAGGNAFDDACLICFCITGFTGSAWLTNPWDNNSSLSGGSNTVQNLTNTGSAPSVTVSSNCTDGMGLNFYSSPTLNDPGVTTATGFATRAPNLNDGVSNNGGSNAEISRLRYGAFTGGAESGLAVGWTGSVANWALIADVLSTAGSGGGAVTKHFLSLMGVGT